MEISMYRASQVADHGRDEDHVFAEAVAEITKLTEQARRRGRPRGTVGIPRDGSKTREQLAARLRRQEQASARLLHAIELRDQMERAREGKAARTRTFLIGQAVVAQMEAHPDFAASMMRLLDDFYSADGARRQLGMPLLTSEQKRDRKLRA